MNRFSEISRRFFAALAGVHSLRAEAVLLLAASVTMVRAQTGGVDLLKRYPTTLTKADTAAARARAWEFTVADVFQVSRFSCDVATNLHVETGPADLGIGHCVDGAVWAVLLPRTEGKFTSSGVGIDEPISHIWLRFHPGQLDALFPPETISAGGSANSVAAMMGIANHKFRSVFHAGEKAVIPDPDNLVIDMDTMAGPRRFFLIDKKTAAYVAAFESQNLKPHPALTPALAAETFDQLWDLFDTGYAVFVQRSDVDWPKLKEQYRPKALACKTSDEFAAVCAEMLKPLRDLHVSLTLAGTEVPVFERPHPVNANPDAHKAMLGGLQRTGRLQWAVTPEKIGFIGIYAWDDDGIPEQFDKALEEMRDTKGLIVDVRCNAGGVERLAQQVAGRFLKKEVIYAYNQFRDGPAYTNLSKKDPRKAQPDGVWHYDKPVVLLIGQRCMGSTEAFIGMMLGDPNVTTMGDRTCGSSADLHVYPLPLEMTVSMPRRLDFKPDGKPLDEHGFEPQVVFIPGAGAFSGMRDDLLKAALERLRKK